MTITTINPTTGEKLHEYSFFSDAQLNQCLDQAAKAFPVWKSTEIMERAKLLLQLASALRQNADSISEEIAKEMGKPVSFGLNEIEKAAKSCEFYANEGPGFLEPRHITTQYQRSYVSYQPLGAVFAIMPWNYPIWQVLRFAIPAILAGNVLLLKHAPNVTGCALLIEKLFAIAGFPAFVFQTLIIEEAKAQIVIEHPSVAAVTLTGSPRAGRAVGGLAIHALKKVVLELGGNDPYVILEDANLEKATQDIVFSRLNNSGQVCVAAKRIITVKSVYEKMQNLLLEQLKQVMPGDPLNPETKFGPLARKDLRDHLNEQVETTLSQGARCLIGGKVPSGPGFYYPPTLLVDVKPGMVAFEEELFGPVITLLSAEDEEDAIQLANQTPYGLGAAVFTEDAHRGETIARDRLEAGSCFVNSYVASNPLMPFGGIKQSGFGRELSSEGIREFTNIKTVVVA